MDSITFLEANEKLNWIEQFNYFYEEINIYRTIVVVNNSSIHQYLYSLLDKEGYAVHKTGDFPPASFQRFIDKKQRVLVATFQDIKKYHQEFLAILMDQHNFLVLENLTKEEQMFLRDTLQKSLSSGLISIPYYIWLN